MPIHAAYDPENIFAKIIAGQIPSVKVMETEQVLAFMDVFPQSEGHTLVIPKHVQSRNFLDFPPERIGSYLTEVQRVAKAIESALQPEGLVITQFNGAAAGQSVFHLHFHIIPRYEGKSMRQHASGEMAQTDTLETIAAKIRAQLKD